MFSLVKVCVIWYPDMCHNNDAYDIESSNQVGPAVWSYFGFVHDKDGKPMRFTESFYF